MKKLLAVALAAGAIAVPLASSSSALCQVGVKIDKYPGYSLGNPVYVETGEYTPYTDCI